MKWLDKNKKLLKEIFDKEFPLNFRNIIQTIILTCLVFILSGFLANKIDTNFLLDKDKIFLLTKFIREIHLNIAFAIILICVIALYIHLALNEYVPSKKLIFFTFLTGIVIYQTALAKEHIFTDCFVYAHIIIILFLCQLGILISHLIKQFDIKKANENKTRQGFLPDNPERNPKKDNKGYSNYAKKIADKIKETHHEEAFAIGINGKWGTGKTTMSEFTKDYLKKEKDIISIDFKPWSSSTPDAIIKDFFETLQDELRPYHAALSRLLIRYSRKLTTIDSNVITQTIEYAANYILDLDATNKVYEKINAALKDIDKKIIIYIDDLDRLEQSEIMEVIRLIRNTANFYNTFFIVAYDKAYVNNALEKTGIYNHEKFLEKIFQLGVNLPYYDKSKLRVELAIELKKALEINESIEKEIKDLDILDDWLENSRDVTRLCNSLILNYPRVKGYVVFKEFLLIEILRISYPSIYYTLHNKQNKFFETRDYKVFHLKKEKKEIDKKEEYVLKEHLDNLLRIEPQEREKIFSLVEHLFYTEIEYEVQNNHQDSIVRVKRFYLYFNYTNFNNVLSYGEFITSFEKDEQHFLNKIRKWVENDLASELFERFEQIVVFESKEDFEKYARALIVFYEIYKDVKILNEFGLKIKVEELDDTFSDNDIEKIIQNIFQPFTEKDTKRKVEFINSVLNVKYFSKERAAIFQSTFSSLLDFLIKNSSKFSYEMSICVYIANQLPNIKNNEIEKIKNFTLKNDHLRGFLIATLCPGCLSFVTKDHISKEYIETLFPDLKEFEELLLSRKDKAEYVEDYLEFYNKCKENDFKKEHKIDFPVRNFPTIEKWKKGL